MATEFIGFTLSTIGEILIAYTVIAVHYRFWKEQKVDKAVFAAIKKERMVAIFGVVLIITGYLLQTPGKW